MVEIKKFYFPETKKKLKILFKSRRFEKEREIPQETFSGQLRSHGIDFLTKSEIKVVPKLRDISKRSWK